jgi:hypothetical protein
LEALFSTDRFEHVITNYLIWRKSCLASFINRITLHVERHTGVSSIGSSHTSRPFSEQIDCRSSENTRISTVGAFHVSKPDAARLICTSSINTRYSCFKIIFVLENLNAAVGPMSYICGFEVFMPAKKFRKTFSVTVPPFAARISVFFSDVEAPSDKSGNH